MLNSPMTDKSNICSLEGLMSLWEEIIPTSCIFTYMHACCDVSLIEFENKF